MDEDENIMAVRVVVAGRVQGVWYRGWAADQATSKGLRGWVRNRRDGAVEALFVGNRISVRDMIEACREGPRMAEVTAIKESPATDDGEPGFRQLPTV